jgi:hypothetical protein
MDAPGAPEVTGAAGAAGAADDSGQSDLARPAGVYGAPRRGRGLAAAALLAAIVSLQSAAWAMELVQEPMPDPAIRQGQDATTTRMADEVAGSVVRENSGAAITPPQPPKSPLRLTKTATSKLPLELDALTAGWTKLNAGDAKAALESFAIAAGSQDTLLAQEGSLGKAYALWRLGQEDQAAGLFAGLVDQDFRVPEILPNLLLLLSKHGGPKAVEPYLRYLPENEREAWRK